VGRGEEEVRRGEEEEKRGEGRRREEEMGLSYGYQTCQVLK
jgi:hypothetical protein